VGDRITVWLVVAAIFATLIALVAFPPAGIVVAVAVGWWMIQTERRSIRESRERFEREQAERERLDRD
jgi:uncharacterized membrane protein